MFDRIKSILNQPILGTGPKDRDAATLIPAWAKSSGFRFEARGGDGFILQGEFDKRSWALEVGPSTRDFISGRQLRASLKVASDPKIAVVVMNRGLKDALDELVFKLYTDSVQTMASAEMPDEMRWVTVFDEFGWEGPPLEFWERYSVMAGKRAHATALLDEQLCEALMAWTDQEPGQAAPFTMNMFRGKIQLRMGYQPPTLTTVQFALGALLTASETAELEFPAGAT